MRKVAMPLTVPQKARRARGATNHHAGRAAEDAVARHYGDRGASVLARRWRGRGGEIDLILRQAGTIVFVEVKAAPDHARAAASLGPAQARRLVEAAAEYLGRTGAGEVDARIDVALVDGTGRIAIVENALAG